MSEFNRGARNSMPRNNGGLRGRAAFGFARRYVIAALALSLGACATDQVAISSATDLSTKTSAAVTQTKTYLAGVQQRRMDANVDLVASDPSCVWASAVYIHAPTAAELAPGKPPPPLCVDRLGATDFKYDLTLITTDRLKPTLALVGAVADYEAAMDKILAEKSPNISTQLSALNTDAKDAISIINGLKLAKVKDPLTDSQLSAASTLIQVAADIYQQQATASDLKALTNKEDAAVVQAIDDLKVQIQKWQKATVEGDDQVAVAAMERALRQAGKAWDFNTRRTFLETLVTAQADVAASDQAASAIVDALSKVELAQKDLHNVLIGNLTNDEKKKRSELERQRMVQVFQALAAAFSAF